MAPYQGQLSLLNDSVVELVEVEGCAAACECVANMGGKVRLTVVGVWWGREAPRCTYRA